eukprot:4591485-Pyramimonas_sp.AAC.1
MLHRMKGSFKLEVRKVLQEFKGKREEDQSKDGVDKMNKALEAELLKCLKDATLRPSDEDAPARAWCYKCMNTCTVVSCRQTSTSEPEEPTQGKRNTRLRIHGAGI